MTGQVRLKLWIAWILGRVEEPVGHYRVTAKNGFITSQNRRIWHNYYVFCSFCGVKHCKDIFLRYKESEKLIKFRSNAWSMTRNGRRATVHNREDWCKKLSNASASYSSKVQSQGTDGTKRLKYPVFNHEDWQLSLMFNLLRETDSNFSPISFVEFF